ncbi:PREDICTED: uncharacterized protein LOC104767865 [Camelina sativa]|uniref:Uncharacterized protein LOC104767865 n=1 Tax=Camelina sativa TaxID=90675 RepID=A0ABM0XS22_CAMSA|nr:PREDICTED: uncharacterized protein LOC104767865 [Camelina sativa]
MVISWLKLTIDENLRTSLSNHKNAHELWKDIKQRFSVRNGQRVQRLKAELATCNQKGLAMQDYYGKLTQLWRSLSDYQQAKTVEEIAKEREEDKLHQFLMGLDETIYGVVKSSLLSLVSHWSVNNTRNRLVCTSCGKTGHLAENCFRKIRYPDWWVERSAQPSRLRQMFMGSSQPTNTGRGRGNPMARANSMIAVSPTPSAGAPQAAANSVLSIADRIGLTGLTNAQWESLKLALDEREKSSTTLTGKISHSSWIIDTGASNHMISSVSTLDNLHDMSPVVIKLPNGQHVMSLQQGTVSLDTHLILHDVYFFDGLQCHLISVSQLTRDRGCVFQITNTLCVIQDRITRMLIGSGEQHNGLYFFQSMDVAATMHITKVTSSELWHQPLGHPSSKDLESLSISDLSCSSKFDHKACDICNRAKQSRDTFPTSLNKTTSVFELVHCDLWGIIHETSCVGTPQQNSRVERKHRHILNVARALRFQASLPVEFWRQCVLAAGYIIKRTPASPLAGKTPFEILYDRPPPLSHLHVFGYLCYVHNQHHRGDKFASRSTRSLFLGYSLGKKGWRVYNLETGKISVSRDVIFCEDQFPYASSTSLVRDDPSPFMCPSSSVFDVDEELDTPALNDETTMSPLSPSAAESSCSIDLPLPSVNPSVVSTPIYAQLHESDSTVSSSSPVVTVSTPDGPAVPLCCSERVSKPPLRLSDYVCPTLPYHATAHLMIG